MLPMAYHFFVHGDILSALLNLVGGSLLSIYCLRTLWGNANKDSKTSDSEKMPLENDHNLEEAHRLSIRHQKGLLEGSTCGCFYCCRVFSPSEITEWLDDGETDSEKTALCPYCGIDSVIGSKSGFPINAEFLHRMNQRWF